MRFHFEVKQDGRHKERLVTGGHFVALMDGISSRSTVVNGISVRLFDLIAHRDNFKSICGDIGNAFIIAPCLAKGYAVVGPKFGDQQDSIVIIEKSLYGLKSSSRAFRNYFADHLRYAGFQHTRYDRDVWIGKREFGDEYDYICTHVGDFKNKDVLHHRPTVQNLSLCVTLLGK